MSLDNFTYTEALAMHAIHRAWEENGYKMGGRDCLSQPGRETIRAIADCLNTTYGWRA